MGLINRMAESIRSGIKNFLQITPASDKTITVTETSNHLTECFINRIWYWGNSRQLAELYRQIDTNKTMFWAAKSTKGLEIRKIHTGLPALICETLVNIVISDYNGTDVTSKNSTAYAERWEDIEKQNKLSDTVKQMLRDLCVVGDGAFKVSFDTAVSDVPIVEWYPAENIDFTYVRGRIREVKFYTDYTQKHRRYRFEETYGYGYIHYALYDDNGKEIDLHTVDALSWIDSKGVTFDESYMWAVPVLYGKSCHKGRGAGIIGIKTDAFDSLDEVWSQWMDALRACRTKQYVPDCLVPRNPETCQPISPNPFDNRFITVGNDMSENGNGNRIYTESPQIQHESYLSSYITALDLCLQGIISPSTQSQVETVSKARQGGLMSVETSVDELYGDSKSEDWKAEEVQRIKEEQGIAGEEEKSELDDVDLTDTEEPDNNADDEENAENNAEKTESNPEQNDTQVNNE